MAKMKMLKRLFITVTLVCLMCVFVKCGDADELKSMSFKLDEMLMGITRDRKEAGRSDIRPDFDFGSGGDNGEELLITKITSVINNALFYETNNYKFFVKNGIFHLAASTRSMFVLNVLDNEVLNVTKQYPILHSGRISAFEVLTSYNGTSSLGNENESPIIVVLSVEMVYGTELRWYILSGDNFEQFWTWPIQVRVGRLLYFRYKNDNRLMTMIEASNHSGSHYTHIDIWGFSINGNLFDFWLSQRLADSDVHHVTTCPAYNGIMVALQVQDDIHIYGYTNENSKQGFFEALPSVKSVGLKNFVCFQSGQILYLGTSGTNAAILDFFESEFQFQSAVNEIIKEEIIWIETIPMDTYRDEVLVLVQLKNNSIAGLAWQGKAFQRISLPPFEMTDLNLSQITVIPKVGFVYKNKIVRIRTEFRQLTPPVVDEMEKILQIKDELTEIMRKQMLVFDVTQARVQNSYLKKHLITGYWRIKSIKTKKVLIEKGVSCEKISLGNSNITQDDFESNLMETMTSLQKFHMKLTEIHQNAKKAIPANSTELKFAGDLQILENLTVNKKMITNNIAFTKLNNLSLAEIYQDFFEYDSNIIIKGHKSFPSINVSNLSVNFINGIPPEDIVFDKNKIEYQTIDFINLKKLVIDGDLQFSYINDWDWQVLMTTVISKSQLSTIPNDTTIKGVITSTYVNVNKLNSLKYGRDYISISHTDDMEIISAKTFKTLNLSSGSLENLITINDSPVNEFIRLHENQSLAQKITFENLEITGSLHIDGNITGGPGIQESTPLLNETKSLMTNTIFAKLRVERKIQINETLNNKNWTTFNDLVTKKDMTADISGRKTFTRFVTTKSINISSNIINNHHINEFATLHTSQTFSHLHSIEANVTFGKLARGDLAHVEEIFSQTSCLDKFLTFKIPPVVDELVVDTFNGNISTIEVMTRLNTSSSYFIYNNLKTHDLHVSTLTLEMLNGINYKDFKSRLISKSKSQELTGNFEIDHLDAGMLHAESLDGKLVVDLENQRKSLDDLYDKIINGSISINTLSVSGFISSAKINNITLVDIYDPNTMGAVIFESNVHMSELNVSGLLNYQNLSLIVDDAVLKTDRSIVIKGLTKINTIACETLDISSWNHHSVDDFLHPINPQVLTGPVSVKGKTIVENTFDIDKRIGNVSLKEIRRRFHHVQDNIFVLNGDFKLLSDTVDIQNLLLAGSIQNTDFNHLQESLIFMNTESTSVMGSKLIKDSVSFQNFTITHQLNDNNLSEFYENVIIIGESSINGSLSSSGNIFIKENMIVTEKLEAKSVMDVDMNELMESAIYLNRPVFIPTTTIFRQAIFSSIQIEELNNLPLANLIPLHKPLVIPGELRCTDITADLVEIEGTVNGEKLQRIYQESFQLSGPQNITGKLTFVGDANIRRDFDASSLNGINPLRYASLDDDEPLIPDLIFHDDVVLNGTLRVLGSYNHISPLTWQAIAVKTQFPLVQTIFGKWTVDGNVHLKGLIAGPGSLNGTDIKALVDNLRRRDVHFNEIANDAAKDLKSICEDLNYLETMANSQIYQLKFFDYGQVLEFESRVISVHYFESHDSDYLFISLEDCSLHGFIFNGDEFTKGPVIPGFGAIERWISLDYREDKYFVTMGNKRCGKSPGNLWKLTNEEMVHVIDLGDVREGRRIKDEEFVVLIDDNLLHYTIEDIREKSMNPRNLYSMKNKDVKFLSNSRANSERIEVRLLDGKFIFTLDLNSGDVRTHDNVFGTNKVLRLQVGILQSEKFVYYDEVISSDYIFISDYENSSSHIVQTIEAHRPTSIVSINFEEFETFLMYIEDCRIKIYQYRGIEGFVYRETLQIEADQLLSFSLKKYHQVGNKIQCLGIAAGNKVKILEGKMYGQRMHRPSLCDN